MPHTSRGETPDRGTTGRVVMAFGAAVVVGVIVGAVTLVDGRLRIADEAPLAALVGISGAIAGWAVIQVLGLSGGPGIGLPDILGPLVGAAAVTFEAWRGRRRTFSELGGLHPHSDDSGRTPSS